MKPSECKPGMRYRVTAVTGGSRWEVGDEFRAIRLMCMAHDGEPLRDGLYEVEPVEPVKPMTFEEFVEKYAARVRAINPSATFVRRIYPNDHESWRAEEAPHSLGYCFDGFGRRGEVAQAAIRDVDAWLAKHEKPNEAAFIVNANTEATRGEAALPFQRADGSVVGLTAAEVEEMLKARASCK